MVQIVINGEPVEVDVPPETPLLWVLRDQLNLTGTKFGCGIGYCGACTVLMNGQPTKACRTSASQASQFEITTIEGLSDNADHPVQQAWIEEDVPQCGYCQSGMVLTAVALLNEKANPTDADIDAAMTNICRCGTYSSIRSAIHKVARARGNT